jgi:HCOMODA/2-hydroxy-3-carboxy-muconic semialdehyde decarboxylase
MSKLRREVLLGGLAAALLATANDAGAQSAGQGNPAAHGPTPDPGLIEDLVAANRILYDQGVVDGFGHVSARHDKDPNLYLMSRSMAPGLVTASDIMVFDLDSNPLDPRGRGVFLERFIHGEIYRAHPEVKAVVHSHSPNVIPFGVTGVALQPVYHMAAFLGQGVPIFEIRDFAGDATNMLVSNRELGAALSRVLGKSEVLLMRGHGDVVVGDSVRQVVFRAIYTEINAKLEAEALRLGGGKVDFLSRGEAEAATELQKQLIGRAWELWKQKALAGK